MRSATLFPGHGGIFTATVTYLAYVREYCELTPFAHVTFRRKGGPLSSEGVFVRAYMNGVVALGDAQRPERVPGKSCRLGETTSNAITLLRELLSVGLGEVVVIIEHWLGGSVNLAPALVFTSTAISHFSGLAAVRKATREARAIVFPTRKRVAADYI